MLETILPNLIFGIAANRLDQHVVEAALTALRGNPTIDESLRDAWYLTIDNLFATFQASSEFRQLPADEREFVEGRLEWFKEGETFDRIFHASKSPSDHVFATGDPADVFLVPEDRARNALLAKIDQLGMLDGLPGGLSSSLRRGLVSELRLQVVKTLIVDSGAVRDTVFFHQFVAIRQSIGELGERSEHAWQAAQSAFASYAAVQSAALASITQQLERLEIKLDTELNRGRPVIPITTIQEFQALVDGLEVLPGAVLTKVEAYLAAYLGGPNSPAPFGGRINEIAALDRWLADPTKPYALLVAPTGRGKSALVSQWAQSVAKRHRALVAFMPVSVRFDTARREVSFAILGARLRRILASPEETLYPDSSFWLTEIDARLRAHRPEGQPLLVIIDGADEAVGWSLGRDLAIPPVVAPGLKVLVAARPLPDDVEDSWRNRLNWSQYQAQDIDLPTLDRAAVRDVVFHETVPRLDPTEAELFASEVYRLSGGDPILVQLYVRLCIDQAHAGLALNVADLQSIEPGMVGYFRQEWLGLLRQWEGADPFLEPVAHALLIILACARGPLSRADLVALTQHHGGSGLRILRALASFKRLVTGNAASGYAFSHPRFGEFFREEVLEAAEVHDWEGRLADYGRVMVARLNAEELAPTDVPIYVLQHHANQLSGIQADPAEVFALITKPWMLAWEAQTGTYDGFLEDLYRSWSLAEELGTKVIAQAHPTSVEFQDIIKVQFHSALRASSIRSLVGSIPFELFRQLVRTGRWTVLQGISYAGAMPSDPQRKAALSALTEVGRELPGHAALNVVRSIRDRRLQVEAMSVILPRLNRDFADVAASEMLARAAEIHDQDDRIAALLAIIPVLPDDLLNEARLLGEAVHGGYNRVRILAELGLRYRRSAKIRLVKAALAEITAIDVEQRGSLLQLLAPALTPSTLITALELGKAIVAPHDRAQTLLALLPRVTARSRSRLISEIEKAIESMTADNRIEFRIALLAWVSVAEQQRIIACIAADFEDAQQHGARRQAVSILARWLVVSGQFDVALELIYSETDYPESFLSKAELLVDLADAVDAPDLDKFIEAFREAVAATESPERQALFYADLHSRVPERFQDSLATSAVAAARNVRPGLERARYLALVAEVLPIGECAAVLDEALESARSPNDAWHLEGAMAIIQLMPTANPIERQVLLELAMRVSQRITGHIERAYVISLLLLHIHDDALRLQLAQEALDGLADMAIGVSVAEDGERISNRFMLVNWERSRTDVMLRIVPFLNDKLLDKALNFSRSITYPGLVAEILAAIANLLDSEMRQEVLNEALELVQRETEVSRGSIYGILYAAVDANLQETIVTKICDLSDPGERARGFIGLVEHASAESQPTFESLACQAVAEVERPQDQYWSLTYLASLVPEHRRNAIYQQAASAALCIPEHWERMMRLSEVAVHLDGDVLSMYVTSAAAAARLLHPCNGRSRALAILTCRLLELGMNKLATTLTLEIEDATEKARASMCLGLRVGQDYDVDEALAMCASISNPMMQAELLLIVTEHTPTK